MHINDKIILRKTGSQKRVMHTTIFYTKMRKKNKRKCKKCLFYQNQWFSACIHFRLYIMQVHYTYTGWAVAVSSIHLPFLSVPFQHQVSGTAFQNTTFFFLKIDGVAIKLACLHLADSKRYYIKTFLLCTEWPHMHSTYSSYSELCETGVWKWYRFLLSKK